MTKVLAHSTLKPTHRGAVRKNVIRKDSLAWLRLIAKAGK